MVDQFAAEKQPERKVAEGTVEVDKSEPDT
jgi:hypothetical protein